MAAKALVDAQVVRDIVSKSRPSLGRPRMTTETENRLADVDRRSAECYAEMELATARLKGLAPVLDDAEPAVDSWDEEPSVVTAVEEVRAKSG